MLGHMVSTWRRLLFNSGFRWDPLLLDEENHLPCSHLLLLPWDMSRGSPGSLLCPRCWVLCTLADSVSLRKCKVPISRCTGTQSQVQTYSLQGRCPKWDLQPMQLQVLTELPWDLLLQGTSESLCNDLQSPFSYLHMWVEVYNFFLYFFFLSDYFHPINNNLECCCHHLHHQPHYSPGSPRWSHKEGFCLTVQITNVKRGWVLLQLHIAHISVPLQNTIHVT